MRYAWLILLLCACGDEETAVANDNLPEEAAPEQKCLDVFEHWCEGCFLEEAPSCLKSVKDNGICKRALTVNEPMYNACFDSVDDMGCDKTNIPTECYLAFM